MLIFIYRCGACGQEIPDLDKYPVELLPSLTCVKCGAQGKLTYVRTEES